MENGARERYTRSELVVKYPNLFVICLDECLEAIVERKRSVSDFLQDCLKKNDRRGKAGRFHQIHLKRRWLA